jgi:hypothetical protein
MNPRWSLRGLFGAVAVAAFLAMWYYYLPIAHALSMTLLFLCAALLLYHPEPLFIAWFWTVVGAIIGYYVGANLALLRVSSATSYITAGALAWLVCSLYGINKHPRAMTIMAAIGLPACFVVAFLVPVIRDGDFGSAVRVEMLTSMSMLVPIGVVTLAFACPKKSKTTTHEN